MERADTRTTRAKPFSLADGYLRDDTSPGDDDMLSRVAREDVGGDLEVRYWRDSSQLEEQLAAAMQKHLKLTDDKKAYIPFNASLGLAEDSKENEPAARPSAGKFSARCGTTSSARPRSTARFRRSTGAGC